MAEGMPWLSAVLLAAAVLLAIPAATPDLRAPRSSRLTGESPRRSGLRPGATVAAPALGLRLAVTAGSATAVLLLVPGTTGLAGALAAGGVAWWRSGRLETAAVRRTRALVEAELPHVVDLVLSAVRSGAAPERALERVSTVAHPVVREELRVPLSRLRLGAEVTRVWADLAQHPQLGRLGAALRRSADSGAPVVDALERLVEDLRDQRRAEVQDRVRQVEVRAAVPLGICLLPSFVLLGVVPLVAGSATGLLGLTGG